MISELEKACAVSLAKDDLSVFARLFLSWFEEPEHIKEVIRLLTDLESGKIQKLMINMPPRHGKSTLCSTLFPAWFIGRNERQPVIISSYSMSLATDFSYQIRGFIQNKLYENIFNKTVKADSRGKEEFRLTDDSSVIAAGVGSGITGKGAGLAIIDDPIKDMEQALSERSKESTWLWYQSVLKTRLETSSKVLFPMTRWSNDDLAGRILETEKDWHVLKLPAIKDGKSLWPAKRSYKEWLKVKSTTPNAIWGALYQQEPIEDFDGVFRGLNINYEAVPDNIELFARIDPAFGGKDYNALVIAGKTKNKSEKLFNQLWPKIHIVYGTIWRGVVDEFFDSISETLKAYGVKTIYVESNVAQILIVKSLQQRGFNAIPTVSTKNKFFRITSYLQRFWTLLRFSHDVTEKFMSQVMAYHRDSNHDDAPDVLAGIVENLTNITEVKKLEWS